VRSLQEYYSRDKEQMAERETVEPLMGRGGVGS